MLFLTPSITVAFADEAELRERIEALEQRIGELEGLVDFILQGGLEPTAAGAAASSSVALDPVAENHYIADRVLGSQTCPSSNYMDRPEYLLCYSTRHRTPTWVAYELSPELLEGDATRTNDFRPDPELPEEAQATMADYEGSGYDRGQLAPPSAFHRSAEAMSATFLLSNVAPQTPQLNRGTWLAIEKTVHALAKKGGRTFVFTGTVIEEISGIESLRLKDRVYVPDGFYKAILTLDETGQVWSAFAFAVPNTRKRLRATPDAFLITVDELELLVGQDFFSNLPDEVESAIEAHLPDFKS